MELFSICIPTYKRNFELIEILENMLEFLKKKNIAVYINDNDEKSELIKNVRFQNLIKQHKKIYYKKNNPNLTIDENMLDVLSRAHSKYCLWLGDDDYIFEKDLEKLYLMLQKNEYDLLILNKVEVSKQELEKIKKNENIKLKFYNEKKSGLYINLEKFFKQNYDNFRYGCLVVKKEEILKINYEKYFGTFHCYSGTLLEVLFNLEKINKTIKINVVEDITVHMLKIKRSWEEVKWEAIAGEMDMFLKLPNNKYKNILINRYYGNINVMFNKQLQAKESQKIKIKLEELEKYYLKRKKIQNKLLKICVECYIYLKYLKKILKKFKIKGSV